MMSSMSHSRPLRLATTLVTATLAVALAPAAAAAPLLQSSRANAAAYAATAATLVAPVPTIAGTTTVGARLAVHPGMWTAGTRLSYLWFAAGRSIPGATGSTVTLTSAMVGKRITVRVVGTHTGYARVVRMSSPTRPIGRALRSAAPVISGTVAVTRTVTAKPGVWTLGTTLTYRWYANGIAIGSATRPTLRLTTALQGKLLTVRVTGSKAGYTTAIRGSAAQRIAPDPNRGKSRTSPYTAGTSFTLGTWTLRLGHTVANAWPQIQLENMFNDAPNPGWSYVMVPVTFTHLAATPAGPWLNTRFNFIGSNGVTYSGYENSQSCGVIPNDADDIGDLYRGATASGNECAVVPTSVVAGGVWRAETDDWGVYRYIGQ